MVLTGDVFNREVYNIMIYWKQQTVATNKSVTYDSVKTTLTRSVASRIIKLIVEELNQIQCVETGILVGFTFVLHLVFLTPNMWSSLDKG